MAFNLHLLVVDETAEAPPNHREAQHVHRVLELHVDPHAVAAVGDCPARDAHGIYYAYGYLFLANDGKTHVFSPLCYVVIGGARHIVLGSVEAVQDGVRHALQGENVSVDGRVP